MYLRVRKLNADSNDTDTVVIISKKSSILELQEKIYKLLKIDVDKQQLFYKGKLLNEEVTIFEYGIQLNDVVILKISNRNLNNENENKVNDGLESTFKINEENSEVKVESQYYKINDLIEYLDSYHGAWFEAIIKDIALKNENVCTSHKNKEPEFLFEVQLQLEDDSEIFYAEFDEIRPRCTYVYGTKELQTEMIVMVNYNIESPNNLGYWYDYKIKNIDAMSKKLNGTILVGKSEIPLRNISISFGKEILRIESCKSSFKHGCERCFDIQSRKCKKCGCSICGGKENPELILICDECFVYYHIGCLKPPLTELPKEDEWYCPDCKNDENEIVKAGEKLKFSKKKSKMLGIKNDNTRDWGKGMATIGRVKECTIVPLNHFGPIPGVEVGTRWKFRLGASEAGVHRPHVAGIHGRENDGAYSLVLSGGYEDDVDDGEEFLYTGSGGRDLSGNKREAKQSCDQKLTKMNRALAKNCNAKINDKTGAEAEDWKSGKPVRVVRNYKLGKHSKYAPSEGNRYDGLYKVVKYYPEKGQSGFLVWRYLLRRDDPAPVPWTEEGQELEMIYPPGYLEAQAVKEQDDEVSPKKGNKRALEDVTNTPTSKPAKKQKPEPFKLDEQIDNDIKKDETNGKLWEECKNLLNDGKAAFLKKVEELFTCICCQELVFLPITTECKHNICKTCLKRSFSLKMYSCPCCRFDLGSTYKANINQELVTILNKLFPGYDVGR